MGRTPIILLVILSLGLLGANFGLQRQNAKLTSALEEIQNQRGPQPGMVIRSIAGARLSGDAVTVNLSDPSLLLLFSTGCKICTENLPRWREVVSGAKPGTQVVYADLTDGVSENYLAKYMIPSAQVVTRIDFESKWRYDLRATPQTVILGRAGKVEKVWKGLMTPQDVKVAISELSK
jgi:hypothetical protein